MTTYDNSYSRFVAWAKILLPLFALAVLSTLFLFSHRIDPTQSIPYSRVEVDKLARQERIGSPRYSGVAGDGTSLSISAGMVRPDKALPGRVLGEDLQAEIETPEGLRLDVTASSGEIDEKARIARLVGDVNIRTSNGYELMTDAFAAGLKTGEAHSEGPVHGNGPLGRLEAGRMAIAPAGNDGAGHVLVFKDGVKLVYDPEK